MEEIKEGSELELINSLKQLKNEGKLDSDECRNLEVYKWRNTVEYRLLEGWLTSENEEVYAMKR